MTASPLPSQYEQEVLRWQADRDAAIRRENTWLALAGLFWLNEGDNSIGSDPESDIKLPERLPAHLGSIYFDGKQAKLRASREAGIKINGEAAHEEVLGRMQANLDDLVRARPHPLLARVLDPFRRRSRARGTRA